MHKVPIQAPDRVVTAARVNTGKESLCGLDDAQVAAVMAGETVYVVSRHATNFQQEVQLGSGGEQTAMHLADALEIEWAKSGNALFKEAARKLRTLQDALAHTFEEDRVRAKHGQ